MKMTGQDVIDRICQRLEETDVRCYDSAIVMALRKLDYYQLQQLVALGDVVEWHNDRIQNPETTATA